MYKAGLLKDKMLLTQVAVHVIIRAPGVVCSGYSTVFGLYYHFCIIHKGLDCCYLKVGAFFSFFLYMFVLGHVIAAFFIS